MTALRSVLFNALFYIVMVGTLVVFTPVYFFLPQRGSIGIVRNWAKVSLFLLKVVCGTRYELRGLENIPAGGFIAAGKHQSLWETFALLPLLHNPAYVIKRQLLYVPIWGWWAWKSAMIYVDRGKGGTALRNMVEDARRELGRGRPVLIFPEGTRKTPGAPTDYKPGIAFLYRQAKVPVVPFALNSGFYWPRRRFLRHPGTILVEFLPAIPPGLAAAEFLTTLQERIETATDRLIEETDRQVPRPPFPPEAEARLAERRASS